MAHAASNGTVVAVVGAASEDALSALGALPGVEALALHGSEPALATRRIAAAASTWVVHDADPLEHVAAAWIELYEERATLGTLEVEVETALARFDAGEAIMPDYYIVLDPEEADGAWRHWWCGALGHRAPRRILPAASPAPSADPAAVRTGSSLRGLLAGLPSSQPWPHPASWLPGLAFDIPDRVGLRE
jgi:hypothetical protein